MPTSLNVDIRTALDAYLRASAHLVDILTKEESEPPAAEVLLHRKRPPSDWALNFPVLPSKLLGKSEPGCASTRMTSHETVRVYIAGCDGLKALAREFCLPLFKIGTTQADLLKRLAELDADKYAANYRHGKKMVTEPGFTRWNLTTIDFDLPKAPNSPIWIEPRALRLRLPRSLAPDAFERLLPDALAGISLASWL